MSAETTPEAEPTDYKAAYEATQAKIAESKAATLAAQKELLATEVCIDLGLPPQWAEYMRGDTRAELENDALEVIASLPPHVRTNFKVAVKPVWERQGMTRDQWAAAHGLK